jgi:hypothetical protein
MPNQIPSLDWPRRTAALTGLEDLLKQNPLDDSYDPQEERIPTELLGDYVIVRVTEEVGLEELANVPVPTSPSILSFDGDEYVWDSVISGFTVDIVGDSGSETLSAGGSLSIVGGDGITTAVTNPTTVSINLDAVLNDLNDVTITSPSIKDILFWNGSMWVNGAITNLISANNGIYFNSSEIRLGTNALVETTEIDTDGFDFTVNDNQTNSAYMGVIDAIPLNFAENGGYLGASHVASNTNSYVSAYVAGAPFNKTSAILYTEDTANSTSSYFSANEDNALIVAAYDGSTPTNQSGAIFAEENAKIYKSYSGSTAEVIADGETGREGVTLKIDIPTSGDTIEMGLLIDSSQGDNIPQAYIRSRNIDGSLGVNGQRLILQDDSTGEAEWGYGSIETVTGATTVDVATDLVVISDPVGGGYTVTIPDAADCPAKRMTLSRLSGGGSITINPVGASLIAESLNITIAASSGLTIVSDGTNWLRAGIWV